MMGSLNIIVNKEDILKFDEKAKENYSDRVKLLRQFIVDYVKVSDIKKQLKDIEIEKDNFQKLRISISAKKEDIQNFKIKLLKSDTNATTEIRKYIKYYLEE